MKGIAFMKDLDGYGIEIFDLKTVGKTTKHCCLRYLAQVESPMAIGYNATISAPHMHATWLQLLDENLQPGMHALDVGSGETKATLIMEKKNLDGMWAYAVQKHDCMSSPFTTYDCHAFHALQHIEPLLKVMTKNRQKIGTCL